MPVLSDLRESVLWLTLSRPEVRNALDHELVLEIRVQLEGARARRDVRVGS